MDEREQDTLIAALKADYRSANITPADRLILDYATKLTSSPSEISADDVERLRQAGFEARAIHDICAITAYFAFVNRIADGLGVELESS